MKRRLCIVTLLTALGLSAQTARHITSPKEEFGFDIGADYRLVNYSQLEGYWKKLASESDRMKLTDIGMTAEGRHQWMAVVSSPENIRNLAHFQDISRRMAAAEGISSDQAHALANEGKAVFFVAPEAAEQVLAVLKAHPLGRAAAIIGHATTEHRGMLVARTQMGANRVIAPQIGEQLPRIC